MKYPVIILLAMLLILSFLFPNRDYSYDSMQYVIDVQATPLTIHPHHLLFYPTERMASIISSFILGDKNEWMMPIQLLNIIIFPLAVYFFYSFLLDITGGVVAAFLCTAIFAFSGCLWSLSLDNEVHTIEIFFLTLALKSVSSRKNLLVISLCFVLAALYHQAALILLPAFFFICCYDNKKINIKRGLAFTFSYICMVGLSFLTAAFVEGKRSLSGIAEWFFFYAESGKWGTVTSSNLFYSATSFFQLFFTSRLDKRILFSKTIHPADYIYILMETAGALLLCCIIITITVNVWKKKIVLERWSYFALLIILPVSIFAFWWEAQNVEFWIPCLISVTLILSLAISQLHERRKKLLFNLTSAFIVILFVHNLFSGIIPNSRLSENETYIFTQKISPFISDGDLLINNKKKPIPYIRFYTGKNIEYVSFSEFPLKKWKYEDIEEKISEKIKSYLNKEKNVFITSSEISPPEMDPALGGVINGVERKNFYQEYVSNFKKLFSYSMDSKNDSVFVLGDLNK